MLIKVTLDSSQLVELDSVLSNLPPISVQHSSLRVPYSGD